MYNQGHNNNTGTINISVCQCAVCTCGGTCILHYSTIPTMVLGTVIHVVVYYQVPPLVVL